jgi:hypothetical protein
VSCRNPTVPRGTTSAEHLASVPGGNVVVVGCPIVGRSGTGRLYDRRFVALAHQAVRSAAKVASRWSSGTRPKWTSSSWRR